MTILRVQGNARGIVQIQPLLVTMSSAPTDGNVLVAVIGTYATTSSKTVSSITQTNVVWTKQVSKAWMDSSYYYEDIEIWLGVVGAAAGTGVSIALSGNPNRWAIADICEYSGILTVGFLDKTANNTGNSLNTDTGTTDTTTQVAELWIGGTLATASASTQSTPTNGFTLLDGAATAWDSLAYLEKIVSGIGTANSGTTISGVTNRPWGGVIATFKAVAGGPITGWRKLKYLTEPPTTGSFNKLKFASEPPVAGSWNKLLYSDE